MQDWLRLLLLAEIAVGPPFKLLRRDADGAEEIIHHTIGARLDHSTTLVPSQPSQTDVVRIRVVRRIRKLIDREHPLGMPVEEIEAEPVM